MRKIEFDKNNEHYKKLYKMAERREEVAKRASEIQLEFERLKKEWEKFEKEMEKLQHESKRMEDIQTPILDNFVIEAEKEWGEFEYIEKAGIEDKELILYIGDLAEAQVAVAKKLIKDMKEQRSKRINESIKSDDKKDKSDNANV